MNVLWVTEVTNFESEIGKFINLKNLKEVKLVKFFAFLC